jgi:serine/threonine protein kinase
LVRKRGDADSGRLYAMKSIKKSIVHHKRTTEHTKTEHRVLEKIHGSPFVVNLLYALNTEKCLYLVLGEYIRL